MESGNFDRMLRAMATKRPFDPFEVEFDNGTRLQVDHPEALVFRGGLAVFVSADGVPSLFDHRSVSRLIGAPGQAVGV